MNMQICCLGIGEEALNGRVKLRSVYYFPIKHHCIAIKRANGELANAQLFGHAVNGVIGPLAFADVDGKTHTVW